MWRIQRSFTQLMKHQGNPGLNGQRKRLISKKVIYRLLLTGTAASVACTCYLLQPQRRGSISGRSMRYVQPAEILELGVNFEDEEYFLVGVIKPGSIHIDNNTQKHTFILTDFIHDIRVFYDGILPTTFREGETARLQGEFVDEFNPVDMIATAVQGAHDAEKTKTSYQPRSRDIAIKPRSF